MTESKLIKKLKGLSMDTSSLPGEIVESPGAIPTLYCEYGAKKDNFLFRAKLDHALKAELIMFKRLTKELESGSVSYLESRIQHQYCKRGIDFLLAKVTMRLPLEYKKSFIEKDEKTDASAIGIKGQISDDLEWVEFKGFSVNEYLMDKF